MELRLTTDATEGSAQLTQELTSQLAAGKQVLWLIPGGSNIPISVQVMSHLDDALTGNLTLALTDERYGPVGHPDSNWQQLEQVGFDTKQARRIDVLQPNLTDMPSTVAHYAAQLQPILDSVEVIIGQFGMGADGHIAGILPNSPAVDDSQLVVGYQTPTFARITTTFQVIERCTVAFLFAFGDDKRPALEQLQQTVDLAIQPAQVLKHIPRAYIYNDQLGDHS